MSAMYIPSHFHAMSIPSGSFASVSGCDVIRGSSGQSRNLRHTHPDFPGASCGTMWTQSPRDILVDTVIPLFSAPMIGACCLGLFLTFSGVLVGSDTMQASALAVPVKKGTRSKAAARTRAMFRGLLICGLPLPLSLANAFPFWIAKVRNGAHPVVGAHHRDRAGNSRALDTVDRRA